MTLPCGLRRDSPGERPDASGEVSSPTTAPSATSSATPALTPEPIRSATKTPSATPAPLHWRLQRKWNRVDQRADPRRQDRSWHPASERVSGVRECRGDGPYRAARQGCEQCADRLRGGSVGRTDATEFWAAAQDANAHFAFFRNLGKRLQIEQHRLWLLAGLNELNRSRRELHVALQLAPDYPAAVAAKGAMVAELPRFLGGDTEGERLLRRAVGLAPDDPHIRVVLPNPLHAMGQP